MATSLTLPKSNLHLPKLVGGVKSIQPFSYPSTSTFVCKSWDSKSNIPEPSTSKLLGTEKLHNEILLSQQTEKVSEARQTEDLLSYLKEELRVLLLRKRVDWELRGVSSRSRGSSK